MNHRGEGTIRHGWFARASERLRDWQRNGWRGPVPDEPEVEARERFRLAGETSTIPLHHVGNGEWGFGLGEYEDDPQAYVAQHAAVIRAVNRFGLNHVRQFLAPEPEPENQLLYEFFHHGPDYVPFPAR